MVESEYRLVKRCEISSLYHARRRVRRGRTKLLGHSGSCSTPPKEVAASLTYRRDYTGNLKAMTTPAA